MKKILGILGVIAIIMALGASVGYFRDVGVSLVGDGDGAIAVGGGD